MLQVQSPAKISTRVSIEAKQQAVGNQLQRFRHHHTEPANAVHVTLIARNVPSRQCSSGLLMHWKNLQAIRTLLSTETVSTGVSLA